MNTAASQVGRLAALVLATGLLVAGCSSKDNGGAVGGGKSPTSAAHDITAQGAALKTVSPGKLTVCSDIPYAPFEYEDNGVLKGIDVDIMKAIGGRLGLPVEFKDTDFDAIFAALAAGKCDVIASSVSITEKRKQDNDFSEPYFDIVQSLLVRKADEAKFTDLPALKGKLIGVQSSTTGADYAKAKGGPLGVQIKEFTGADEMFTALKAGQIEAILQDFPVNQYNAQSGETVVVKRFTEQKESYGIVIPKNKPDLKKAINDSLARIKADDTYPTILKTYLGDSATQS